MPRPQRIEQNGFYHIVNRGVAKCTIFYEDDDFKKFLQIIQEASEEYGFEIFSFALMSNHYHLLIKIANQNLSLSLQKINSRYSMYFNRKYKRVGPLWQGRFKSWYVYDTNYLQTLVRYIEFNPIKVNLTLKICEYKWAMSSKTIEHKMLNYELINGTDFEKELDEHELNNIEKLYSAKLQFKDTCMSKKEFKPLDDYFEKYSKESAIYKALQDGYRASQVAAWLHLSNAAITKIIKRYKQKVALFEKLRDKGIFWSYSKELTYDEARSSLVIEYALKYADFDDIKLCLELFGKREVKAVWEKTMQSDKSFIKTNLMVARVFFGMDVESDYFKKVKNARFEKLKLFAS